MTATSVVLVGLIALVSWQGYGKWQRDRDPAVQSAAREACEQARKDRRAMGAGGPVTTPRRSANELGNVVFDCEQRGM